MCCIFTCVGWVIDIFQRLWTFTMSCCISSAVCCILSTASIAGIALGYNYSLAEYIDLKETNVSIYIKRGIFDDEISDDFEWRRSGHLPIGGHIGENNLMTGAPEEPSTIPSGRRLDDSIYESNDKNNFEDSLMKLRLKPLDLSSITPQEVPLNEITRTHSSDLLNQLKDIQSAINLRKMAASANRIAYPSTESSTYVDVSNMAPFQYPKPNMSYRRMPIEPPLSEKTSTMSSLRNAVPDDTINDPYKWMLPKLPPRYYSSETKINEFYGYEITYPTPITAKPGPVRPTRFQKVAKKKNDQTSSTVGIKKSTILKSLDEEMESFKDKFLMEGREFSKLKENEFKQKVKIEHKENDEYYEDDVNGTPLRKKRNMFIDNKTQNIIDEGNNIKLQSPIKNKAKSNISILLTKMYTIFYNNLNKVNETDKINLIKQIK